MTWKRTLYGCVCVVLFVVGLSLGQEGGLMPPEQGGRIVYVDQCCLCENGDGLSPDAALATIQEAIDLARNGDRVFVFPGVYRQSLDLKGKAIVIKGVAGPLGVPILVATQQCAVAMLSGEDEKTVLQNLIIKDSLIGISLVDSTPTLQNLTIVTCGIGVLGLGVSDPMINSCIVWGNTLEDLAGVTAFYSCLEKVGDVSRLYNISTDPLFVDAGNQDYRLKTTYGRFEASLDLWVHDEMTSPCISTGDPASEYGLEPPSHGNRINMGAFGNTLYASTGPDPSALVRASVTGGGGDSTGPFLRISVGVESPGREIVAVEFYSDGLFVARDDDPLDGWQVKWYTNFPEGQRQFELIAVAEDQYGVRSLSEPVLRPTSAGGHGR